MSIRNMVCQPVRSRAACHEVRVNDDDHTWRLVCHFAADAIVLLDVFSKKTPGTPQLVIEGCQKRLAGYQRVTQRKG